MLRIPRSSALALLGTLLSSCAGNGDAGNAADSSTDGSVTMGSGGAAGESDAGAGGTNSTGGASTGGASNSGGRDGVSTGGVNGTGGTSSGGAQNAGGSGGQDPACATADSNGFFSDCTPCGTDNCDSIDTGSGERRACGCNSSADCPCGFSCDCYEIAPNITVCDLCVR